MPADTPSAFSIQSDELEGLREENAKLRQIIIDGVMLTSDQLKIAMDRVTMAEHRAAQARIALRTYKTNCEQQHGGLDAKR